uniref:Uncharacterized protein n=1 Tax=Steinernema glaseri TaxID=37863 RepID=A0A1I7YSG5_9BILA
MVVKEGSVGTYAAEKGSPLLGRTTAAHEGDEDDDDAAEEEEVAYWDMVVREGAVGTYAAEKGSPLLGRSTAAHEGDEDDDDATEEEEVADLANRGGFRRLEGDPQEGSIIRATNPKPKPEARTSLQQSHTTASTLKEAPLRAIPKAFASTLLQHFKVQLKNTSREPSRNNSYAINNSLSPAELTVLT